MLVRYLHADRTSWGKLVGAAPRSGKDSLAVEPLKSSVSTTRELISLLDANALEFEAPLTLGASQLLSPITSDSTLVCQGLNYSEHAAEAQQHTRRSNLIFAKASSSLTGPYSPIVRPTEVELLDYEVEIGLVLRTELTADAHVSNENVGHYVAGVVRAMTCPPATRCSVRHLCSGFTARAIERSVPQVRCFTTCRRRRLRRR